MPVHGRAQPPVAESRVLEPCPGLRVPDFFIVGHAKSGTTALYEMLRQHPQIFMPASKEPPGPGGGELPVVLRRRITYFP